MDWTKVLEFARGPFFQASLLIFIAGMVYPGTRHRLGGPKKSARQRQ